MKNNQNLQDNLKAVGVATKGIKTFVDSIIDEASFVETDVFAAGKSFIDGVEALGEGVLTGYATIDGNPVTVLAENQEVLGGSFSVAHAKKMKKAIAKSMTNGTPLVSIIDCSGARIGEGVAMLEAYAEVLAMAAQAKDEIVHICIVKGNAVGMMASFVSMADYVFMADNNVMSLTSPMVLASALNDFPKLNTLFGAKAYSENSNIATFTYNNEKDLATAVKALLAIVNGEGENKDDANRETPALDKAYSVATALKAICDDGKFIELSAAYSKDVVTALTKINGIAVGILATDSTVSSGNITVGGIKKASDFVELCENNGYPIISLVDAKGVAACIDCEVKGLAKSVAKLMSAIANSTVEKISVITGNAVGIVYSMLASKGIGFDYSLAFANACITPINSDAAVNVVYADDLKKAKDPVKAREELANKYAEIEGNVFVAAKDGFVDNIIEPSTLRPYLASALLMLLGI